MNRSGLILTVAISLAASACTSANLGSPVEQKSIGRIELMAQFPQPYKMIDWAQKGRDFDAYAFDFNPSMPAGPMIWLDSAGRNIPQVTYGLYTAVKDARQGREHYNGEFHESLNDLHALISAGLLGIDKTAQNGFNFVKMEQNYFNTDNGWNIIMNNTCPEVALLGGGYGRDWWYDVFPNCLYYMLCEVFPGVDGAEEIQHTVAEQFAKADSVLAGNYDFTYFDYAAMKGCNNWIPKQQDAAGGHAYVLYSAYKKFGDPRYLEHAISATKALDSQSESRFYEILLPMGIYTAARLNAEQGQNFNLGQMFDWVFDGCKAADGRTGWGIMAGKWGDYEVSGLQGSLTDGGGFAFLMNSLDLFIPFIPTAKYAPEYADAIGKWALNCANACRLFYPDQLPDENQSLPGMQDYTNSIIAYEGLRYQEVDGNERLFSKHPIAVGDGPKWNPNNPKESMFSCYSSGAAGILGAMLSTTDVEGIVRFDCNTTDFYADKPYECGLIYNPYDEPKTITLSIEGRKDLFDAVSKTYLAKGANGKAQVTIPAGKSLVLYELPSGSVIKNQNGRLTVKGNVISYK
ncbi:MAG: hypothetical protein HUJ95_04935 [Bacteroidales bacterium]|nr:hypothetical protein [Bacteroidales bacterium]